MNILCSFCNIFFLHLKTQNPTTKTPIRSNIFVQIHFLDDFCSKCFLVATSKRTPTLEFISCTYRDSRVVRSAGSNNSCKTTLSLKYSVLRAITKFSTLNYNLTFNLISHIPCYHLRQMSNFGALLVKKLTCSYDKKNTNART